MAQVSGLGPGVVTSSSPRGPGDDSSPFAAESLTPNPRIRKVDDLQGVVEDANRVFGVLGPIASETPTGSPMTIKDGKLEKRGDGPPIDHPVEFVSIPFDFREIGHIRNERASGSEKLLPVNFSGFESITHAVSRASIDTLGEVAKGNKVNVSVSPSGQSAFVEALTPDGKAGHLIVIAPAKPEKILDTFEEFGRGVFAVDEAKPKS